MVPLIELKNISKSFGDSKVLDGVNLKVHTGEIISLIGKSGEGKSVLLKTIVGLIDPDDGDVLFKGKSLFGMSRKEKEHFNDEFSYMFQGTALFDSMTVSENIALPLVETKRYPKKSIQKKVQKKIRQLELVGKEDKFPSEISGGMKKRVALARALITDPSIIFFDEPTTGLDPIRKNAVYSMIVDYQKQFGFTGVVVSHDIPDVFYVSQKTAMLLEGQIVFSGNPDDIIKSEDIRISRFLKGTDSNKDTLTGLYHKSRGQHHFEQELMQVDTLLTHVFCIVTFENIHEINEKYGHIAGQTILKNFVNKLTRYLRESDICSKIDINKLMVLLSDADISEAKKICMNIADRMRGDNEFGVALRKGDSFRFRANAVNTVNARTIDELIIDADHDENIIYKFIVT